MPPCNVGTSAGRWSGTHSVADPLRRALAHLADVEEPLLRRIAGRMPRHPRVVRAVTALGSRPAAYSITCGCAAALVRRGQRQAAVRTLGTLLTGDLAREFVCRRIGRERPPVDLRHGHFTGSSFPSRHATLATLTAGAVINASRREHRGTAVVSALLGCAGVGASRVRLGVHWPTDVAAGFLFAAIWRGVARRSADLCGGRQNDVV